MCNISLISWLSRTCFLFQLTLLCTLLTVKTVYTVDCCTLDLCLFPGTHKLYSTVDNSTVDCENLLSTLCVLLCCSCMTHLTEKPQRFFTVYTSLCTFGPFLSKPQGPPKGCITLLATQRSLTLLVLVMHTAYTLVLTSTSLYKSFLQCLHL